MLIIKFGGSVITEKSSDEPVFRESVASRLIGELKFAREAVILVHGAGSFAHPLVIRHNLFGKLRGEDRILKVMEVNESMRKLNSSVMSILYKYKIPAIPFPPYTLLECEDGEMHSKNFELLIECSTMGFIPVTYGDMVLDKGWSCGVLRRFSG